MKTAFSVVKDRRTLKIRLTRDSVAAGDDLHAPHEKIVEVYSFVEPVALINHVYPGYLPQIAGIGHSWDCVLNGRIIATITVEGVAPRVSELSYGLENLLHFSYRSATY